MNERDAGSFWGFAARGRAGRRGSACGRPSTVPFEQIGHSAVKRLWRQKSEVTNPADDTPRVRTALISDLHLGTMSDSDVLRHAHVRERLWDGIAGADRLVLLGDVIELREAPLAEILERSRPFFEELRDRFRGEVVVVPGNHDHHLVSRWLEDFEEPLGLEHRMESEILGLPMAYPGLWVRDDVYATHGHYLDAHMTIPRIEAIAIGAVARLTGGLPEGRRTPGDYEGVLAPIYSFAYSLAQARTARSLGTDVSRKVWARLDRRRGLGARALGGVAIPLAVAGLNRAGLGPYEGRITRQALRRSGVQAMEALVGHLGIEAEHVIFGHTHRPGPLPSDHDWQSPGGTRLVNTGSWLLETGLTAEHAGKSPYWPGTAVFVDDEGPPRIERLLQDLPIRR